MDDELKLIVKEISSDMLLYSICTANIKISLETVMSKEAVMLNIVLVTPCSLHCSYIVCFNLRSVKIGKCCLNILQGPNLMSCNVSFVLIHLNCVDIPTRKLDCPCCVLSLHTHTMHFIRA